MSRTKGAKDKAPRQNPNSGLKHFASTQAIIENDKDNRVVDIMARLARLHNMRTIPKFESPEDMALMIEHYFAKCIELKLFPTKRGMSITLGTTYEVLCQWERGSRGPEYTHVLKKAGEYLADVDEQMVLSGIENPVLFMFRSKNYHGLRDQQEYILTPNNPLGDQVDPQEIAKRLAATIDETP